MAATINALQPEGYAQLLNRLQQLTPQTQRQWGKMNPAQMLMHCAQYLDVISGKTPSPKVGNGLTAAIARFLFLDLKLRMPKNLRTAAEMLPPTDAEFEHAKAYFLQRFAEVKAHTEAGHTLPPNLLFGKLSTQRYGVLVYLHFNHHWQQFGL
jgi:hypothetical protein